MNTFLALFLQTILTIAVSDKRGLALDIKHQFLIYGAYFLVLGSIFVFVSAYSSSYSFYQQIRRKNHLSENASDKDMEKVLDGKENIIHLNSINIPNREYREPQGSSQSLS